MTEVYGKLGIDLTETPTSATHGLGESFIGGDGTKWLYVQASGAIDQYDAVGIDENYQAQAMVKSLADDGWRVGFAQVAFADNDYGWVAIEGSNIKCNVKTSCAADVALYTSGTVGHLDDSSTGQTKIDGVVAVAAVTAATNTEVIATWPRSATF